MRDGAISRDTTRSCWRCHFAQIPEMVPTLAERSPAFFGHSTVAPREIVTLLLGISHVRETTGE